MRDPFASFPVSCDWDCHISRGSAGGTDYGISVGTPIHAAFDGVLTNRPPVQFPASGNVAILTRSDGLAFYHLHLSRFATPGRVAEGVIIGYSGGAKGASGSGSSTGPHLHVNAVDPQHRVRDIHDYFTTTTAGSGGTPIEEDELSAADVAKIIEAVTRESVRWRIYQNMATSEVIGVNWANGDVLEGGQNAATVSYWESIGLVGQNEKDHKIPCNATTWKGVLDLAAKIRAYGSGGSAAVDLSSITRAIAEIPTAAENAAAARAAIIK